MIQLHLIEYRLYFLQDLEYLHLKFKGTCEFYTNLSSFSIKPNILIVTD